MEWRRGIRVRGAAGRDLGRLLAWGDDGFIVEQGWLVPRQFLGTREQIAELRDDELRLRVERLAPCDIDDSPGDWGYVTPLVDRTEAATSGQLACVDEREWYAAADDPYAAGDRPSVQGRAAGAAPRATHIPLVEEVASFDKRLRVTERIRVRVVVKTEQRTIVMPVRRQEVVVERVPVLADEPASLEPGERVDVPRVTVIPVLEEEVEICKHPVVREEVRITRTFRRDHERLTADLRREVADVAVPDGGGPPGDGAPARHDEPS